MHFEVFGKMVRARESLVADFALIGLDPGVGPLVPCQFVGAREAPAAACPGAGEGLLAGVPPQVGLEMRAFGVDLGTTRVGTVVDFILQFVSAGTGQQ